jgi:hypothetical protein
MPLPGAEWFGRLLRPNPTTLPRLEFKPPERRSACRIRVVRSAVLRWRSQLDERSLLVRVFDRSPEGVGVSLPQQLPVGLPAAIRWEDGELIQTVVRHCRRSHGQFVAGLMHLPHERRVEDREPLKETAELFWDDLMDGRVVSPVYLRNVSSGGLCCRSTRAVPVPLVVCLTTRDWQYYGKTRYCAHSGAGYSVGIELVSVEFSDEMGFLPR